MSFPSEATFDRGLAAAQRQADAGDSESALWIWSALAERHPDRHEPMLRAAHLLRKLARYGEADALLLDGQAQFPNELGFFFEYCHIAELQGVKTEILRRWELALERVPHHPVGYSRVAGALRDLGRYQEADEVLLRGQARFPNEPALAIEHPRAPEARGDWAEALVRWTLAAERFPDHAQCYVGAAAALRELKRLDEADRLLQQGRLRFPNELAMLFEYCRIAEQSGDLSEILRRWQLVLDVAPDHPIGYSRVAGALRDLKRYDEADAILLKGQAKFPGEAALVLEYPRAAEARMDWAEALIRWNQARARFPDQWQAYAGAAAAMRAGRLPGDADSVLREGLERFPHEPALHLEYCRLAEAREDWPEAARRWSMMRERLPDHSVVFTGLAYAYREQGRFDEADAVLREAQQLHPREIELFVAYALTALVQRNLIEAGERWGLVRQNFPNDIRGFVNEALILSDLGDHPGADSVIAEAIAKFPDRREVFVAWGDIASRQGDIAEATRRYEIILEKFSDDFEITMRLFDLHMALSKTNKASELLAQARRRWPDREDLIRRSILLGLNQQDFAEVLAAWQSLSATDEAANGLKLDLAVSIFKEGPPIGIAQIMLEALAKEADSGDRDWLPKFAEIAAFLVLANKTGPQWLAARSIFEAFDASKCDPAIYLMWKTALGIALSESEILHLFEGPLTQNRMVLIAQIFSSARTRSNHDAPARIAACFERFIAKLADDTAWISYDNARQLLGYLTFATVYSLPAYQRLIYLARQTLPSPPEAQPIDATTPQGALASILSYAPASQPSHASMDQGPAIIARRSRPLRIAYCISGQLRGFRQAYQTWTDLGHEQDNAEIFVHTWSNIGRNWSRTWRFLQAYPNLYAAIGSPTGLNFLRERFPSLAEAALAASGSSDNVDDKLLSDFYQTEHVCVEDDAQGVFAGKPNVWKMYYKIQQAHQMALNSGIPFDLFIRLRPDQNMKVTHQIDWERVAYESTLDRALFVDIPFEFIDGRGILKLADAFAAGGPDPMLLFSTTLSRETARLEAGVKLLDSYRGLHSHLTSAYDALYAAVVTKPQPSGLLLNSFLDPPMLSPKEVLALLINDIGGAARDSFEAQFMVACRLAAEAEAAVPA